MRVTTTQYETNLWSTNVNTVRLAEPQGAPFAGERGLWQAFPSFPSPSPTLIIWLLFHFSLGQNRKFHGLSLLHSQMEMLATQASGFKDIRIGADGT